MRVLVASVAEFFERVPPAYMALAQGPPDEPATLEIDLAPGPYGAANLSVGDPFDQRPIDIIIRAEDAARPPLLTGVSLKLAGDHVRLERLIFVQRVDHLPLVSITAGESLTIDGCAWLGNQVRMPPEGRLVEVIAHNPHGLTDVAVRHSWFVRNWALDGQALIAAVTDPPYAFQQIAFEHVAFLDNHGGVGVVPHATARLDFTDCVVLPADDAGEAPAPLAAVTSPGTQLTIGGSLVVANALAGLVRRWSAREPSVSAFQVVTIRDSEVVLRDPAAPHEADATLQLPNTQIRSASPAAALQRENAIAKCATELARGALPDLAAVRAALVAAL